MNSLKMPVALTHALASSPKSHFVSDGDLVADKSIVDEDVMSTTS